MLLDRLDTVIAFAIVMLLLSLLITTLVQMVGLLFALRGRNLLWGVKRLLGQVDPRLGEYAAEIGDRVLRHPAVSHLSRFRAVAVRKEEVIRILTDLAEDRLPQVEPLLWKLFRKLPEGLKAAGRRRPWVKRLLLWLWPNPAMPLSAEAKARLKTVLGTAVAGASAEGIARVQGVAASLADLLPSQAAAVKEVVDRVLAQTNQLSSEVNAWFDTVMDRSSERFKLLNRWITAATAFAFVFFLQVDSVDLLRQLSNAEVREGVIELYEPALRMYDEVSGMNERRASLATDTLIALQAKPETKDQISADAPPADLDLRSEGEGWLRQHFAAGLAEEQKKALVQAYDAEYSAMAKTLFTEYQATAGKTQALLDKAGLEIIPDVRVYDPRGWKLSKVFGIAMTGFLLSLGAPFWFNTLRKLSDLRPIVARRVDGEAPKGAQ